MILSLNEMRRLGTESVGALFESQLEPRSIEWASSERLRSVAARFDIFLSHSYLDRAVVIGVYQRLKSFGFSLYVDWIHDPQLNRSQVTPTTANLLRQRMRQCNSLFYITTSSSTYSKWMPWETGYFDGHDRKQPHDGHVAILPVLDPVPASFVGQEYLGLYCWADVVPHRTDRRALQVNRPPGVSVGKVVDYDSWIRGMWP
jgi:hypothetical protein